MAPNRTQVRDESTQIRAIARLYARARDGRELRHHALTAADGPARASLMSTAMADLACPAQRVLTCRGDIAHANVPYAGLQELLAPILRESERGSAPFDGPAALLHDLLANADRHPTPDIVSVVAAVTWVLAALGEGSCVLVVAEDTHRLDPGTRRVLDMLATTAPPVPALLLTTNAEDEEVTSARELQDAPVPDGDLVELGQRALQMELPDIALRLFDHALRQPADQAQRARTHAAAAHAALATGDALAAIDHWDRALQDLDPDAGDRFEVLLAMADALLFAGDAERASAAAAQARDLLDLRGDHADTPDRRRLLASATASVLASHDPAWRDALTAAAQAVLAADPAEDRPSDRLLLVAAAMGMTGAATDATTVAGIAARAAADGRLVAEQHAEGSAVRSLTGVLLWSSRFDEELVLIDAALADARARGSVVGDAINRAARGHARWTRGDIRRATVDLERALALTRHGWRRDMGIVQAAVVLCRIEAGLADDARSALAEVDAEQWSQLLMAPFLRWCDAALLEDSGALEAAADEYVAAHEAHLAMTVNPAFTDTWSRAVELLTHLGRHEQARDVLASVADAVETWGAARTDGLFALCEALVAEDPVVAEERFKAATAKLRSIASGLDLARALHLHGTRRARDADRDGAVLLLDEALDVAEHFGCARLAQHVRVELGSLGAERRTEAPLLTPGELRVAVRAATGATNRAIAEELFLTVKTVEWHLSRAYAKLGVSGRGELADALPQAPTP